MSEHDRDLAQFFADRPSTLLELVGNLLDAATEREFNRDDAPALAEISRRLTAVEDFHGTEATRMRAILDTGADQPWWQK